MHIRQDLGHFDTVCIRVHLELSNQISNFKMDLEEENKRISLQVTAMSTQLMESISKQSELEESLSRTTKELTQLKLESQEYKALKAKFEELKQNEKAKEHEIKTLSNKLTKETELKTKAEEKVKQLEDEVEDLTASLFDEANNMVADARKETHTTEILNRKLLDAVKEKDNTLETMEAQLKHLRKVVEKMDVSTTTNNRYSVVISESDVMSLKKTVTNNSITSENVPFQNAIIYSPNISSIRFDLNLYTEFLKFLAVLPVSKTLKDTTNDSKLIRRIVNDEITPVLKIDSAPGVSWLAKKYFLNHIIEGLVIIQPLSGINETFQMGSSSTSSPALSRPSFERKESHLFNYPIDSPPVAVHEACALCGECRDDIVQHARMHVLKTQSKQDDGSLIETGSYPLCLWCLLKVRQTADIFSFLRSLKLGTWNLEKVTLKNNKLTTSRPSKSSGKSGSKSKRNYTSYKRKSFMSGFNINSATSGSETRKKVTPHIEGSNGQPENLNNQSTLNEPNSNIERAWLQLCKLRCMLHWAHVGVWSIDDSCESKFGPIQYTKQDEYDEGSPTYSNIDNESIQIITQGDSRSSMIESIVSPIPTPDDQGNISPSINGEVDELNETEDSDKNDDTTVEVHPHSQPIPEKREELHTANEVNKESEAVDTPAENDDCREDSIDIIGEYHDDTLEIEDTKISAESISNDEDEMVSARNTPPPNDIANN